MLGDALRLQGLRVTAKLIPTGVVTQFFPENINRVHLAIRREGTDFFVAYQNEQPSGSDEMWLIDTNWTGEFWDRGGVPQEAVWVLQESGSDLTIKMREL